jgi:superfamily II DNA/RNA helicase
MTPPRVTSIPFAELGLPPRILQRLQSQGMSDSFPIQAAVIPDALAGRDVAGRAPTGSGKTLGLRPAVGRPLDRRQAEAPRSRSCSHRPVSSPSRSWAEIAPFAKAEGHAAVAIYGGVGYGPQKRALDRASKSSSPVPAAWRTSSRCVPSTCVTSPPS